jgi:Ca-activated chloride channel family protein
MQIESFLDHQAILVNHAQPVHFVVRITTSPTVVNRPKPAAFCIVLDRSGSMEGQPLTHAKAAASLAAKNLRPEDHFAMVVFDDQAQTFIPLQKAMGRKNAFLHAISQIEAGNSTNLTGGRMLGRDALRDAPADAARRLLLLTDGQLNAGIVEPDAVKHIVATGLEKDQVRTSCLGFGDGYNEDLLVALAGVTNGQFHDAASPEKLQGIFAAELDGLQKLSVQNLRLRIKALDFCDGLAQLSDYPALVLPDGRIEFAIGDLVADEERVICFALTALPVPLAQGQPAFSLEGEPLLAVEALYDEIVEAGVASRTFTQTIRIRATQDPGEVKLNGEVVQWVAVQKAGKAMEEATRLLDARHVQEGLAVLERTHASIQAMGDGPGVKDALAMLESMRGKVQAGAYDARARKAVNYERSSSARMSSKRHWAADAKAPFYIKKTTPLKSPPSGQPKPGRRGAAARSDGEKATRTACSRVPNPRQQDHWYPCSRRGNLKKKLCSRGCWQNTHENAPRARVCVPIKSDRSGSRDEIALCPLSCGVLLRDGGPGCVRRLLLRCSPPEKTLLRPRCIDRMKCRDQNLQSSSNTPAIRGRNGRMRITRGFIASTISLRLVSRKGTRNSSTPKSRRSALAILGRIAAMEPLATARATRGKEGHST